MRTVSVKKAATAGRFASASTTVLLVGVCLWAARPAHAADPHAAAPAPAPAPAASAAPEVMEAAASAPSLIDPMEAVRERLKDKMRVRASTDEPAAAAAAAVADPESLEMERLRTRLAKRLGVDAQATQTNELRLTTRSVSPAEMRAARAVAHTPVVGSARLRANSNSEATGAGSAPLPPVSSGTQVASANASRDGAASSPSSTPSSHANAPIPGQPWAYDGPNGPQAWGRLKPDYAACANGKRQSPIDIRDGIQVNLQPLVFDYRPTSLHVVDDGRGLSARVGAGNAVQLQGRRFELQTVQFHTPAEDRVQGKAYDMSADFVHQDAQGRWLVVSVLLERGPAQPVLQTVLDNLPLEKGDDVGVSQPMDWSDLMPADPRHYIYMGSLSAPPCTEGVMRIVMKTPMTVSSEQFAIFSRLYPMNARPVQAAAGRMVKESR